MFSAYVLYDMKRHGMPSFSWRLRTEDDDAENAPSTQNDRANETGPDG